MKAAQINEYGGKEVLEITENAPMPKAGEDQVLVEVRAAAVNPFDWKVREGLVRQMAELEFPATLGGDFAGVVVEIGHGVDDFGIGDEVYGQANALGGQGSFAEYTPVKVGSIGKKPGSIDFVSAAAMPLAGVSAYQALVESMKLMSGQKILVHGGAGGIASFAIPLAKNLGAYVTTTAAAEDADFVKSLGADEVIDYKSQDFSDLLHGFDAVFDTVGGETFRNSFKILRKGGIIVSMIEQPDEALMQKHEVLAISQFTRVTTERLAKLAEMADKGKLKPQIDKTFSLDEAADALEYIHQSKHRGKVVITVK